MNSFQYRKSYQPVRRIVWSSGCDGSRLIGREQCQCSFRADHDIQLPAGSALLLDFGCELAGGAAIVTRSAARCRLRFGESASEAMGSPDQTHAIHDTELQLPALGTFEYGTTGFRFLRIDADVDAALKEGASDEEADKALSEAFSKALSVEGVSVKVERFKTKEIPAVINVAEFSRRFREMNAFYGMEGADEDGEMTLVLNAANPIVQAFSGLDEERQGVVARQVYYLAKLSYKKLSPKEMENFSLNTVRMLEKFVG